MNKEQLKRVLENAVKLAKDEKLTKEDALDEAYRRSGKGKK